MSWVEPAAVAEAAKGSDWPVYVVTTQGGWRGIAERRRAAERLAVLQAVADASGGLLVSTGDARGARRLSARLVAESKQRYLVSYYPHGVGDSGWHNVEIRVKRRGVEVKARRGYQAGHVP